MALFSVDFYSKFLFRPVNIKVFIPNDVPAEMTQGNYHYDRPTKTLVLLHGYNGGNLDWALLFKCGRHFFQIQPCRDSSGRGEQLLSGWRSDRPQVCHLCRQRAG